MSFAIVCVGLFTVEQRVGKSSNQIYSTPKINYELILLRIPNSHLELWVHRNGLRILAMIYLLILHGEKNL